MERVVATKGWMQHENRLKGAGEEDSHYVSETLEMLRKRPKAVGI